jgi:alpha/beta superfamily hydrolase
MYPKGNISIPVAHGQLEGIYRPRSSSAERVALVLHPHPLFGGTMHNKVVYRAAKALEEAGFETLRVNFRGVGESTGVHDEGRGEIDDARAALDYLLLNQPEAREVVVAGFSFGAVVGLKLGCEDPRVSSLVAIGTPLRMDQLAFLDACAKPVFFIHGEADELAPLPPLKARLATVPATLKYRLQVIPNAGHFFDHQLDELMRAFRTEFE